MLLHVVLNLIQPEHFVNRSKSIKALSSLVFSYTWGFRCLTFHRLFFGLCTFQPEQFLNRYQCSCSCICSDVTVCLGYVWSHVGANLFLTEHFFNRHKTTKAFFSPWNYTTLGLLYLVIHRLFVWLATFQPEHFLKSYQHVSLLIYLTLGCVCVSTVCILGVRLKS